MEDNRASQAEGYSLLNDEPTCKAYVWSVLAWSTDETFISSGPYFLTYILLSDGNFVRELREARGVADLWRKDGVRLYSAAWPTFEEAKSNAIAYASMDERAWDSPELVERLMSRDVSSYIPLMYDQVRRHRYDKNKYMVLANLRPAAFLPK